MKIIVTGGAGFIGSHVTRALVERGHAVTVLDNFNDFYDPAIKRANLADLKNHIEIVECDLRNEEATLQIFARVSPEMTLHFAARAGVRPSILNPKLYLETNINGTLHVLEGARQVGCERFIFASSSSIYGATKTLPFHEDIPLLQTLSPYAATKLAGEHLCGNYSYLYGMRVVALRFFTVYGAGQRPDLAIHRFTNAIEQGCPIQQFGDGSTRRDYTYIEDIVQGVLGATTYQGSLFDIFNLGEYATTSLAELIALLEKTIGRQAIIERLAEQKGDMPVTYADITKAKKLLGYNPQTPLESGLAKFVEWYRDKRVS
ncbi:MAG: GDP-mannose 4,6-dehydratase [Chthoniobacterales bacterium]|nr:GDP-mannose 4,6-dehydratase [Chthoniobacterales bacterium]